MAIVKILARHKPTYKSLIEYILNEAKAHKELIYTQNLRSDSLEGYVREFMENEAFRKQSRSDQIFLFHEIISFHADENNAAITREMIGDLASEYMRLRGESGVMLAAAHNVDAKNFHLHFCVSAVHYRTGKAFGLNKAQLNELKQSFQRYHGKKYPEISKSFPAHGKGREYASHSQWHARQREKIAYTVRQCFAGAKSQNEFLERLRDNGLHHYERVAGKPTGIDHEGAKYRFSRMLETGTFEGLPVDRSEEEKALEEIRSIRGRQQARDLSNRDIEDRAR